jgi:GDPmannose 4,6-dehydratase
MSTLIILGMLSEKTRTLSFNFVVIFGRISKEKLPISEEENFHPASPYAISKVGTDLVGRFYAQAYNMKVMVTRMFTHTGPRRGDVFAES